MRSDEVQVKKGVEKLGKKIHEVESKKNKNITFLIQELLKSGCMPKDVFNFSDQQIEGIYAQAYNFYQTGRYNDALQIFRLLVVLNPGEMKYALGIAASLHMMKEYQEAVEAYTLCSVLDPLNPVPHYHMSDCFVGMRDRHSAKIALETAIRKAGDKPEYQILKDRASLTIKNLKKE